VVSSSKSLLLGRQSTDDVICGTAPQGVVSSCGSLKRKVRFFLFNDNLLTRPVTNAGGRGSGVVGSELSADLALQSETK
jgi:hypothetical protein